MRGVFYLFRMLCKLRKCDLPRVRQRFLLSCHKKINKIRTVKFNTFLFMVSYYFYQISKNSIFQIPRLRASFDLIWPPNKKHYVVYIISSKYKIEISRVSECESLIFCQICKIQIPRDSDKKMTKIRISTIFYSSYIIYVKKSTNS